MSETIKLADLTPDGHNANAGTERGRYMVERSLSKLGAGRSILLDKNGTIIAGNKTAEAAASLNMEDVIIIRTDGTKLVAVLREDLDLNDPTGQARELAYVDNRTGQVGLEFDAGVMEIDIGAGLDLSDWWQDWELEAGAVTEDEWADAFGKVPDEDRAPFQQMTFTLHDTQVEQVKAAISAARQMGAYDSLNENGPGNGLARVCETFISEHGQS